MPEQPPVPVGSPRPFQTQGEWWHEQPDGTLLRWSAFNDAWVPAPGASKEHMLGKDSAFYKSRRRRDFGLPVVLLIALFPLMLVTMAMMQRQGASVGQSWLVVLAWVPLGFGAFYLMWRKP